MTTDAAGNDASPLMSTYPPPQVTFVRGSGTCLLYTSDAADE